MFKCILFVFSLSFVFTSFAHEYYFSFAEMEYNTTNKKLELTLIVSTHDIEHWLQDKGIPVKELEDHYSDSLLQKNIGETLLKGYSVTCNKTGVIFHIIGYDVLKTGVTEFYFSSNSFELMSPLLIRYDLLMDKYPAQQNKLTFIYNSTKESYSFLPFKNEQNIEIIK